MTIDWKAWAARGGKASPESEAYAAACVTPCDCNLKPQPHCEIAHDEWQRWLDQNSGHVYPRGTALPVIPG